MKVDTRKKLQLENVILIEKLILVKLNSEINSRKTLL